jgi:signal transduction histidine kinase
MNVLLLITGNPALAETIRAMLPGTDLLVVETGVEAAGRRLVSLPADVILLDDGPGLGGPAIAPVKALAPSTPLVVLSARGDMVTQAGLGQAGADAVVVKPFACEALLGAIALRAMRHDAHRDAPSANGAAAHAITLSRHQMALRWLGRAAANSDDPERLSRVLVESAADIFDTVRCVVLLERDGTVRVAASQGLSEPIADALQLSFATGLLRWFDERASLVDRESAQARPDALKELHLMGAQLAVPLLRQGRVFGMVALGERACGGEYLYEEKELLTLIARAVSVMYERADGVAQETQSTADLGAVFAHVDQGVIVVKPDKTVAMMNHAAETLLELRAGDMMDRSVQKLGSAFADLALRTLADRQPRLRQRIRDAAVGAQFEVSVTPMDDGGVAACFSRAAEASAASGEVAQSPFWEYLSERVAQEIKNPMVAINTFAQLLPRKYDSEDFREAFSRVVQKEVERINGVVETLFEFARDPRIVTQRCGVRETVQNILKSFEDELARRNIALEVKWDPGVDEANIDPVYFGQAVHNVLQNSIDAMPNGGTLSVSTQRGQDGSELRIADTGAGVKPQDEPLVFLPFYSTKERGMGLGLPMARRIMQQHQGELKLAANAEGGSIFAFRLPSTEQGPKKSEEAGHANDSGD